jgi:outer membrane receptor for ferrienterochelin and colicin
MKRLKIITGICSVIILVSVFLTNVWAGQTGKIVGKVIDTTTDEPLLGVNIMIDGTMFGSSTDAEGDFFILNIPPGSYTLVATMIGYKRMYISDVKISVDGTSHADFKLESTVLTGETVTIIADQFQRDRTTQVSSVSVKEIEYMPVETLQDILQLQTGVVKDQRGDLHIRGGRSSEIAYLVDGVSISDPYDGKKAVNVDQGTVQEMKVISGTFNAEYGQVMSGIIEIVTKDPDKRFRVGGSFYTGDYISSHKGTFMNIDDLDPFAITNGQIYLTGPVPFLNKKVGYYLSLRRWETDGWQYGQRRYNPSDSTNYDTPGFPYIEQTGDNEYVPMNNSLDYYANLKLVNQITDGIKLSYNFLGDISDHRHYDHIYKYNPDGALKRKRYGYTHILNFNHTVSPRTFYTLKFSHYTYDFKEYAFEDRDDPRYVDPIFLRTRDDVYSFLTGGTKMEHFYRTTTVNAAKFDLTSQMTKNHLVKLGLEYKYNSLKRTSRQAEYRGVEGGGLFNVDAEINRGTHKNRPIEIAAYIQDKVEIKDMILNIGLRYDYFNSRWKVPKDLRAPGVDYTNFKGYKDSEAQHQISPRIGLAFPVSGKGSFHTSYGHFFQIPPLEQLYMNEIFLVPQTATLNVKMGNADLKPQSTVIYEVGYQQELMGQFNIDVTGFYKDARNLLGTEIIETYVGGTRYARYMNRDYGNIRGITFAVNKQPTKTDHLTMSFDYTYQVAEGNASDPDHEFLLQSADPPKQSNIQVVPLEWDQRHTVNVSVTYNHPSYFGISLIGQLQSGLPYTPEIQNMEQSFEYSGRKPLNHNIDLRLFKQIQLSKIRMTLFVNIYNLFDRKNELDVYKDTGRSSYSLINQYIGERNAYVNTLDDWLNRPEYYSEPRRILIGCDIDI